MILDERFAAAPVRDDLVVDGGLRLSSAAMERAVAELAGGLRAAGIGRGDAVAWQLPNSADAVLLYRACWRLGAIATPVHHLAGPTDVDAMLGAVGPRLVLSDGDVARLRAGGTRVGATASAAEPGDVAVILFTSGTSGAPKAVQHTQGALAYKAGLMVDVHGLTRDDAVLMPAPLAHISGLLNGVLLPGAAGMRTVLQARWDPDDALGIIEREQVSFMIGPPTFFVTIRGAAGFARERVRSLRLVSCGGAGVTAAFVAETAEAFDAFVKRTYGSTEAPTVTTAHAGDPAEKARTTDGRPTGAVELRIGDDDEVLVRGPELFAGYLDPEQTRAAFTADGWFRSGDRGLLDVDGWLTITGRLKDVIIRAGENIAVAEVESVCEAHPAVRQAVAVGEPDARVGERVAVFVVLAPGSADDAFDLGERRQRFTEQGIARFKTPERVVRVDAVPVLAAGKPDRGALKDRLLDSR